MKIAYLLLLILSGTTLIGSILGAVYQLDFGWWLVTVLGAVAVAFAGLFFLNKFSKQD